MLVVSRKEGESIVLPGLGITIEVLGTSSGKVKIGIDAPREVKVLRSELQAPKLVTPSPDKANMVAEPPQSYCVSS